MSGKATPGRSAGTPGSVGADPQGLPLFRLDRLDERRFLAQPGDEQDTPIFGGQLLGQAMIAALTVEEDGRVAHSLHASFLRPGDGGAPVRYEVASIFDGRSFATRQVLATQDNRPLLLMTVSFHRPEDGPSHQETRSDPGDPETAIERLAAWRSARAARGIEDPACHFDGRPIQIVPVDPQAAFGTERHVPRAASWIRCRNPLPPQDALQRALLTYASDMMLLRCSMLPHGIRPGMDGVQSASLDHALWIHALPDLNDWHLFETTSSWSGGARGMSHGRIFARDGTLVAEVAQECLMRLRR